MRLVLAVLVALICVSMRAKKNIDQMCCAHTCFNLYETFVVHKPLQHV